MPRLIVPVNDQDHILGSLLAPVTLVEYGDYQCFACKMTLPIIKQFRREFGEKLCFVFRNFPLKTSRPYAWEAAKTAEAAALQNKFWEMHELLYAKQFQLNPKIWPELAEELKLDIEKFKNDFLSPNIEEKIQQQLSTGLRSGVNGTPCFYINGERYDGDLSYDTLKQALSSS